MNVTGGLLTAFECICRGGHEHWSIAGFTLQRGRILNQEESLDRTRVMIQSHYVVQRNQPHVFRQRVRDLVHLQRSRNTITTATGCDGNGASQV